MTNKTVAAASTPADLNRALTIRACEAFDKTRSTRELATLAGLVLQLLKEGRALAAEADADPRPAEPPYIAPSFSAWTPELDD